MATLTGVSISSSYTSLLKLDGNTDSTAAGNGSNAIQVKTGDNEATPLFLNTDRLGIGGQPSAIFHSKGTNNGASLTLAMLENVTSDANSEARLFFVSGGNLARGSYITSINTSASGQPADLAFATSSAYATPTERMRIDSSGNVGIGIANPTSGANWSQFLQINHTTNSALVLTETDSTQSCDIATNGAGMFIDVAGHADATNNVINFRTEDTNSAFSPTTRMTINSSGNVGIGTSSPNEGKLVVQDGTKAELVIKTSASATDTEASLMFKTSTDTDDIRKKGGIIYKDVGDNGVGDMFFVLDSATDNGNATVADDTAMVIKNDGTADHKSNYIVNEQGRQNHVANTMASPYYRFDGSNDKIEVADNANLDFATNDFSTEALVRVPSGVVDRTILAKIDMTNSANEGYAMEVGSNGKLAGRITGNNTRVLIAESSKTIADGLWHHVCITFDRSGSSTVYVDGVADGTTTISGASGDASNSNPFQIGTNDQEANFTEMEISHARVFNNLLTATEVKELYSGASVEYKYKGASQTNILTGVHDDFDTDVANQSAFNSNYTQLQATGFVGSGGAISVSSNVMAMTGIVSGHGINGLGLLTKGKKYRMTFNVTAITGNWYLDFLNQSESAFSGTGLKTVEWTAGGSDLNIYSGGSGGALTIDASSTVVELIPIGAVAEYNGSGITENKWYDGSGNELHGTVSGASDENTASAPVLSDNHPAFLVQPNAEQTNIAVDSTVDIVFDVERFDQGSNFASNTFTAPVTGKYFLNVSLYGKQVDSASDYIQVYITTSNRTYTMIIDPDFGQDAAYWSFNNSVLADMDVNDTAKIQVFQSTGSAQLDIGTASYFSGYLVC